MNRHIKFYWVNLGSSYKEVIKNKFLWAPDKGITKNGKTYINSGWKCVKDVKKGDIIFCCTKKDYIDYIAIAKSDAMRAQKPQNYEERWDENGHQIEIELKNLESQLYIEKIKDEFYDRYNDLCTPKLFTNTKGRTQNYMISMPTAAGLLLLNELGKEYYIVNTPLDDEEGTEREVISKSRIGHNKFREKVFKRWKNKCPVTGLEQKELLVASHIYPWCLSSPKEKVDVENGFPFAPSVDKAFDKGLITFKDDGTLYPKDSIEDNLEKLGINKNSKIEGLSEGNKKFLAKHRELHDFK